MEVDEVAEQLVINLKRRCYRMPSQILLLSVRLAFFGFAKLAGAIKICCRPSECARE
jgi:hypothetical protein